MKPLLHRGKACWLLALVAITACGGNEFTAGSSGGAAGSSGGGGGKGSGGAASGGSAGKGSGGSSGTAQGGSAGNSSGGTGNVGGVPPSCVCGSDQYCQVTTNTCRDCADFSRLAFAAPEKIATISSSTAGQQRFPRAGAGETELFYRAGPLGDEKIWHTPDFTAGYGTVVSTAAQVDSGPLFLIGQETNLVFDRAETPSVRRIVTASWNGTISNATLALPPLNPGMAASSDYSVALALSPNGGDAARAFWMTTRIDPAANRPELVTAEITDAAQPEVVALNIATPGGSQCPRAGNDATPWVSPTGDLLLFRSFPVDDSCAPIDGDATDLYATVLVPATGQPSAPAIPLADVNRSTASSTETDPSLSANLCALYYASDSGEGVFEFDIFRAVRH